MAAAHTVWYGIVVEFDHVELGQITNHITTGAASVATVAAVLAAMGITAPIAVVAAITSALLQLGAAVR